MSDVVFGPFVFEMSDMRLLRDDAELRLRPQARRVLRVLLLHRGHTIGYEQMMAEAWEGTFVSRHTVDVTVAELRKTLGEFGRWITHRTKEGYSLDVPSSEELIRRGWHFWSRRTREGAERAIECFQKGADECPGDFRAYEGLSTCYLMLATFSMRAPLEVYPKFLEAHERAVAAGGMTGELHCNRGQGLHLFERNVVEAEAEFLRAAELKPAFGATYVRSVMLYATQGRLDEALEMVRRAYRAQPLLPTAATIEVDLHVWRREFELASVLGEKAVELHPYLQVGRAAYAQALQFSGKLDDALAQYRLTSVMCPDLPWLRALEGTCLAAMGLERRALPILEGLEQLRQTEYVDAYYMAVFRSALGQREQAFAELERACAENGAPLFAMMVDPKLDGLRGDRRVAAMFASLYGQSAGAASRPHIRRVVPASAGANGVSGFRLASGGPKRGTMRNPIMASLGLAAVMAGIVSAQSSGTPRTPWGDPDLQGTWSSEAELSVPFERAAQYGDRRFLTDAEFAQRQKQTASQVQSDSSEFDVFTADTRNAGAVGSATSPPPHWLERGKASKRTSLVIDPPDGRVPATVQVGRGRGRGAAVGTFVNGQFAGGTFAGPQDLSLWERCITRGVPAAIFPTVYNANIRIVQGPGAVAITYEMIHDTRVIPIGPAPHVGSSIRGYEGDSRGHWEGDTLVVDTTNFSDKTNYRGSGETLHLVERFRRDKDGLQYEVTVDDSHTWTKPWTAALTLDRQPDDSLFEYGCHEGNNSMRNILSAARKADAK